MADKKRYLDSSGLVTYDGLIKKHISGKFTDSTATFAGTAAKSNDSSKLGGAAASSFAKTIKVGTSSYTASSSSISLPAYPTLSSLGAAKDASLKTTDTSLSSLTTTVNNHTKDTSVHITTAERTKWNKVISDASSHIGNSTIHITSSERTSWNKAVSDTSTHIKNSTIHITSDERTKWNKVITDLSTHSSDAVKHITSTERTRWNNTYTKTEVDGFVNDLSSDITDVSGKISAMGNVFKFKGTKDKKSSLPTTGNEIGDVWHVTEDTNEYVYDASGNWELIGSAHTQVSASASLSSGTKVGTITVDGTSTTFYAPTPSITKVSADASLTSGTQIGSITVNNTTTKLYAPTPTSVTVTQNATSGLNVGTIKVGNTSTTLYLANPNTDSKVKHTDPGKVTTKYPLLAAKTNGTATEEVYHSSNITLDSSNGSLYAKTSYCVGTNSTDDANSRLTYARSASSQVASLYSGGNELNLVYNSSSSAGTLWINYGKSDLGQIPTKFNWTTGGGNNGKYASHTVGSIYSPETYIIMNSSTNENIISYIPDVSWAASNSIVLGNTTRSVTIATASSNSGIYHGTSVGNFEIWDSKNLSISRGVNLFHGTYTPSNVFSNSTASTDSTYGDIMVCKYSGSGSYLDITYKNPLRLKNGATYTISFYVKADSAFTSTGDLTTATGIYTHLYNTNQSSSGYLVSKGVASWGTSNTAGDGMMAGLPFTTSWKRVYITYTLNSTTPEKAACNTTFILFRIAKSCTHTVYVADIQMEEGVTSPTEYTEIGSGDLAPLHSNMCDLGTDRNAWRMVHANGIHLAGAYDEEDHTSSYGGMIYFGDPISRIDSKPSSEVTNTYIGERADDVLTIHGNEEVIIENGDQSYCSINADNAWLMYGATIGLQAVDNSVDIIGNTSITGTCNATGGFFETSDIRKKNIISELPIEKCYELVDKCQEIVYTLKSDPNKERVGMIAQEVECFFPEIISEGADGYKSLDYAKLSVVCLRLLKDIIDKGGYKPKSFSEKVKTKVKRLFSKKDK